MEQAANSLLADNTDIAESMAGLEQTGCDEMLLMPAVAKLETARSAGRDGSTPQKLNSTRRGWPARSFVPVERVTTIALSGQQRLSCLRGRLAFPSWGLQAPGPARQTSGLASWRPARYAAASTSGDADRNALDAVVAVAEPIPLGAVGLCLPRLIGRASAHTGNAGFVQASNQLPPAPAVAKRLA